MSYEALYRKYRPQHFDQVVGQEHVTRPLQREIAEGKVAHSYLFAGPRGTGKTTTARLLAKALNCTNPSPKRESCGECISCTGVKEGRSLDVLELDAASHNKVEDIRELRAGVSTVASVEGGRRVYILDEAHMLTKAACNALLKTLEEPPERVHFVLATTEPYKLLDTIRSRSQRFDFRLVSIGELVKHLEEVSGLEGYDVTLEGLTAVARRAEGSVRDALSLLEQVAATGTVTEESISRALGVAGRDTFLTLSKAIAEQDSKAILDLIANLVAQGVDLRRFASDTIAFFRGVFLINYGPETQEIASKPDDMVEDWRKASEILPDALLKRAFDLLGEALVVMREEDRDERITLEVNLLKLALPKLDDSLAALADRVERLERGLSPTAAAAAAEVPLVVKDQAPPQVETTESAKRQSSDGKPRSAEPQKKEAERKPPPRKAASSDRPPNDDPHGEANWVWEKIVELAGRKKRGRVHAMLVSATPLTVEEGVLNIEAPNLLLEEVKENTELVDRLELRASELLKQKVKVTFHLEGTYSPAAGKPDISSSAAAADGDGSVLEEASQLVEGVFETTEVKE